MDVKRLQDQYTSMTPGIPTALLGAATAALSHKRLSNYRTFFQATTDAEQYGLYCWNEAIAKQLFCLLGWTEVALRNQIHNALSNHFGQGVAWFNYLNLPPKSEDKIKDVTHRSRRGKRIPLNPMPSPDDVVSKMTFGFWNKLLDISTTTQNKPVDWSLLLLDILPGHRQKTQQYWQKQAHQDQVYARIDLCNGLRNRIMHHEPIWKFGDLLEERRERKKAPPLAVVAPAPTTPAEAIIRLDLVYQRALELLGWCSPSLHQLYVQCEAHSAFLLANSQAGLNAFRYLSSRKELDLADFRKLTKLKKALKKASRAGHYTRLKNSHQIIGQIVL